MANDVLTVRKRLIGHLLFKCYKLIAEYLDGQCFDIIYDVLKFLYCLPFETYKLFTITEAPAKVINK